MTILSGLDRIKTASDPIAVFRIGDRFELDFVFAKTAITQARIHEGDPALVGVFDRNSDPDLVRSRLNRALGQ